MKTFKSAILILFIVVWLPNFSSAQNIEWTNISEQYSLPEGVQLYEGTRPSPALKAWYIEVDLSVSEIGLVPYLAENGTETVTEFSKRIGAIAAINGGYFGGNSSYSTVVQPGKLLSRNVGSLNRNNRSYPVIRSAFSIAKNRDMAVDWIYHFGSTTDDIYRFNQPMGYTNGSSDLPLAAPNKNTGEAFNMYMGIGGGPILVKGDSVHVSYNEEIFWGSGVGLSNRDPRTAVGYTADETVEVSEGWTASANSGYWGESPSLITLGGDGSKTVRFSPELPSAGTYRVDGWWVSSFNRSKKTPYIIHHRLGVDTVYANQSTNSSQWLELGEYEFNANSEDMVIISNFGGDSFNYVVADAVRWVGINEELTSNETFLSQTPKSFELLRVYPNPFNPLTQIEYSLEQAGTVKLEVYDLQGRLVESLVNTQQQSGTHRIQWLASSQSTGLYFVRIQFENSESYWYDTHKVTLLK